MMFHEIAPKKLDIFYRPEKPTGDDYVLMFEGNTATVKKCNDEICALKLSEVKEVWKEDELRYLFSVDGQRFFLAMSRTEVENTEKITIRDLRNLQPMWMAYAVTLGFRLGEWYKSASYCGKCGEKNVHSDKERAMVCPVCGNMAFPQISPSVIVLIRNKEKTLLTRYQAKHSAYRRYALVAGYVESGETPEEAVTREVMEEVGLKVKNITYYKSQPWPLSGALLFGYVCDLDGDEQVTVEEDELEVAEWVLREDVPDRSTDVSLTSEMMEMFRTGRL